jgi:two-component system, sensor histidine kinase PdtaS
MKISKLKAIRIFTVLLFILSVNQLLSFEMESISELEFQQLEKKLSTSTNDSSKCAVLSEMLELNHDHLKKVYTQKLKTIAVKNLEKLNENSPSQVTYSNFLGNAILSEGKMLLHEGKLNDALKKFMETKRIYEKNQNYKGISIVFNRIGNVYEYQGDFEKALDYYSKSLNIKKQIKDKKGIANTLNNIGNVYRLIGDNTNALINYEKSYHIEEEIENQEGIARSLQNIGLIYLLENKPFGAQINFQKALNIYKKLNDNAGVANSLHNLGESALLEKRFEDAIQKFNQALILREKTKELKGLTSSNIGLSNVYFEEKNFGLAEKFALAALQNSKSMGNAELIRNSADQLYKVYKQKGNYSKALEMHEISKKMNDSVFNMETRQNIIRNQMKFELESEILAEKLKFDKENQLKQIELKSTKNKQYAFAFLAFIVLIFSISLYRRFKLEKNQKKIIEDQKIELELLIKEVHHRVKNNLQIISSLLYMQGETVENEEIESVLQQSQNRIQAMALIHEQLYQSGNLKDINVNSYFDNLIEFFRGNYSTESKNIEYHIDLPPIFMNTEQLIPLGLIANECILNSIKYAFPLRDHGTIKIYGKTVDNDFFITFEDDGIGIPDDWEKRLSNSLGMNLITGLTRQLRGNYTIEGAEGTKISITFKLI